MLFSALDISPRVLRGVATLGAIRSSRPLLSAPLSHGVAAIIVVVIVVVVVVVVVVEFGLGGSCSQRWRSVRAGASTIGDVRAVLVDARGCITPVRRASIELGAARVAARVRGRVQ